MALATDCNPGSSPITSLPLVMNMACTLFRMTPLEALQGVTVHAARALGLTDRGTIAPGSAPIWPCGRRGILQNCPIASGRRPCIPACSEADLTPEILIPGQTTLAQLERIYRDGAPGPAGPVGPPGGRGGGRGRLLRRRRAMRRFMG